MEPTERNKTRNERSEVLLLLLLVVVYLSFLFMVSFIIDGRLPEAVSRVVIGLQLGRNPTVWSNSNCTQFWGDPPQSL